MLGISPSYPSCEPTFPWDKPRSLPQRFSPIDALLSLLPSLPSLSLPSSAPVVVHVVISDVATVEVAGPVLVTLPLLTILGCRSCRNRGKWCGKRGWKLFTVLFWNFEARSLWWNFHLRATAVQICFMDGLESSICGWFLLQPSCSVRGGVWNLLGHSL